MCIAFNVDRIANLVKRNTMDNEKMNKTFGTLSVKDGKLVRSEISVKLLEDKEIFGEQALAKIKELQKVYKQLPETKCNTCGKCCNIYILNNVYTIEFLNIVKYLKEHFSNDELFRIKAESRANLFKAKQFEKKEFKPKEGEKWHPCPFIDPKTNLCKIQEVKPLVCRIYGVSPQSKDKCKYIKAVNKEDERSIGNIKWEILSKQIEELSENFIALPKTGDKIITTKAQSLDIWLSFKI
ncbi:MAG: YkgJ family cysteine cluster protein [Candidatus Omnitrophica bacterium]|nr:YkgJ family cysteine cluster protein [Candidatus Omnitrophota bacterium]